VVGSAAHGRNTGYLRRLEDTPSEDCGDIKLQITAPKDGTPFAEVPLKIVSQDTTTVTLELTNAFPQTVAAAYVQYEVAVAAYECAEYNNFAVSQVETITVECMVSEPVAVVTVIITDPAAVSGDANIPICCHADSEEDPAVAYTFSVSCVPLCEPEPVMIVEEIATEPPTPAPAPQPRGGGRGGGTIQRTSAMIPN
jgi:hypothetical protein